MREITIGWNTFVEQALALLVAEEPRFTGAVRRLREVLQAGPVTVPFDGQEIRVASTTQPDVEYVTVADYCTCPARVVCWHLPFFRVVSAFSALSDPHWLVRSVRQQTEPPQVPEPPRGWANDMAYDSYFSDLMTHEERYR